MQRVLIVGCGGAGKSTLAKELGALLDLPVVHLDTHFWNPGWVETERERWEAMVREMVAQERWVMDGNYGGTIDIRLAASDTVLLLDLPRRVCILRVLKRWWTYRGRSRPDLAGGCPERIDLEFLRWIWNFRRNSRPRIAAAIERHRDGRRIEVFRSTAEVRAFVDAFRACAPAGTSPDTSA